MTSNEIQEAGVASAQQQHAPPAQIPMELDEDDIGIRLSMDLPGVRATEISVEVQRGVLSIRGYRSIRGANKQVIKKQRIARRFAVDTDVVDVSRASANLANGELVICAPKKSTPKTFKIPVTDDPDFDAEEELKQASEAMDEGIQVTPAPVVKKEHVDTSAIEPIVSAPVTATTSTKK